jgi:tRNA(adenine34) deaminase
MQDKINQTEIDEHFMRAALELARQAQEIDEVPVGAIAVRDGEIIATAYNTRESSKCATHHAEILVIEEACRALGGWRLPGVTLYVTMEPCCMCAGAIINARIPRPKIINVLGCKKVVPIAVAPTDKPNKIVQM